MTDLVPFGKHKGKPVDVLLADSGYREWLLAQPWVRDRYPTFHQTIINYAGEPAETPEHNQLQASFLDDSRCLALARLLYPASVFDGTEADWAFELAGRERRRYGTGKTDAELLREFTQHLLPVLGKPEVLGRQFEVDGWDLVFTLQPPGLWLELRSLPVCLCGACEHERCSTDSVCRGGEDKWRCRHRDCGDRTPPLTFEQWQSMNGREVDLWLHRYSNSSHCDAACPWVESKTAKWLLDGDEREYLPSSRTVQVECKPDLGDDFPAVLRQVTRREEVDHRDRRCVVVRRYASEHVSWEQVTEMFRTSGITLIREQQLAEAQLAGEPAADERSTT